MNLLFWQWRQSPEGLFTRLCRIHQLRWSDRRLLRQLVKHYQMADPACIFVEPERFNPRGLPPYIAGRAARLAELRENLFDMPVMTAEKPVRKLAAHSSSPLPSPLFVVGQKRPSLDS